MFTDAVHYLGWPDLSYVDAERFDYDMVMNAPKFDEAMKMFSNWCLGVSDDIKIYAWSENDYKQISKEIGLKKYELSLDEERVYLTEWNDFQAEFDTKLGFEKQLSLKIALDLSSIKVSM